MNFTPMLSGFLTAALTFLLTAGVPPARGQTTLSSRKLDVPYEPTPQRVVDAMLRMAQVKSTDFLIDLGCGDGRIPVTAAERYGVKTLCVDLDPNRIREARANARRAKVEDKVQIVEADLFKTDISAADVLTLYLWPEINLRLRPRVLELRPGTRIVSHEHNMGNWRPDATQRLGNNMIYLWHVPAKIGGSWRLSAGDQSFDVTLTQVYQKFDGLALADGRKRSISDGRIVGRDVTFQLAGPPGARKLSGRLNDAGELEGEGWKAVRAN